MKVKKLNGYSGCSVELWDNPMGISFVRKTSPTLDYNNRLIAQAKKQGVFFQDGFKTPRIIDSGFTNQGLYYFEMQFIPGLNLNEAMNQSYSESMEVKMLDLLSSLTKCSTLEVPLGPINLKIKELQEFASGNEIIKSAWKYLKEYPWETTSGTYCHGDLSLENMLISQNEIYLIDFQDVVTESHSQDVAKLLFDLEFNWSSRNDISQVLDINNLGNRRKLMTGLKLHADRYLGANWGREIDTFQLFNAMRILPYIRDAMSGKVLNSAIDILTQRLELR